VRWWAARKSSTMCAQSCRSMFRSPVLRAKTNGPMSCTLRVRCRSRLVPRGHESFENGVERLAVLVDYPDAQRSGWGLRVYAFPGHYLRPEGKAGQSRDMQGRRGKEGSLSAE
jgi:hypothetical protein